MKFELRFYYFALAVLLLCAFFADLSWPLPGELEVAFLDIGQGDSILITTPHKRRILIDGGPGVTVLERLGEETSHWLSKIDLLMITHPDLDHLEGLLEVVDRYKVEGVLMTGVIHGSSLYRAFLERLNQYDITPLIVNPEEDWLLDEGVTFDIIWPKANVAMQHQDNMNNTSIVAMLRYGDTSMLLPGDAEKDEEHAILLTDYAITSEFLKIGHHGSTTSSNPDFLRAVNPERGVIIAGRDNQFNHPHLERVLNLDERNIEWLSTKKLGTIVVRSDGDSWETAD
ncbi:MAG: MBL fold metallo-hydrolase [Candidatus Gracilibacteria bacterium]|nr:MBL fold metallo-hydrolase [Candidatus Gracilibacteria bacterium]